jgi:hypothetical protein
MQQIGSFQLPDILANVAPARDIQCIAARGEAAVLHVS